MRIAYLCGDSGIPLDGNKGASIHVRAVADALGRRGHDVRVVAVRQGEAPAGFAASLHPSLFDRTLKGVKKAVRAEAGAAAASAAHGLLMNSRTLDALEGVHRHGPVSAVYERYSLWSTAGLQFARRHAIPFLLEVNAPLIDEQRRYRELAFDSAAEAIERTVLSGADAVFVPSSELVRYVREKGAEHVVVAPNAVDLARFRGDGVGPDGRSLAPEVGIEPTHLVDRFVVAFLGSLKPWHGVEILCEAFEALLREAPEAHLLVVGNGPLLDYVVSTARRVGQDAITATGPVPHEHVPAWLAYASVGVAPYPPIDGFYFSPLKVFEYLAASLPVVASDIGQLRDLVVPDETGLLVPPGDAAALTAALADLLADPARRRTMGRRARRQAERHHGWDAVAARIEETIVSSMTPTAPADADPPGAPAADRALTETWR